MSTIRLAGYAFWISLLACVAPLAVVFVLACKPGDALPVVSALAPLVDPLLRVVGFCREHPEVSPDRVAEIVRAVEAGDRVGAALKAALVLEELRAAGVQIPPAMNADLVLSMAAVEGLQRGLRALSCRDPSSGAPVPGCVDGGPPK